MFTAYVITVSDKGSVGERVDTSGEVIVEILKENNYEVIDKIIIRDDWVPNSLHFEALSL